MRRVRNVQETCAYSGIVCIRKSQGFVHQGFRPLSWRAKISFCRGSVAWAPIKLARYDASKAFQCISYVPCFLLSPRGRTAGMTPLDGQPEPLYRVKAPRSVSKRGIEIQPLTGHWHSEAKTTPITRGDQR